MKNRARVRVVLEINLPDTWNKDSTLAQVEEQATAMATDILRQGMVINGTTIGPVHNNDKTHARVIGEPVVTVLLLEGS